MALILTAATSPSAVRSLAVGLLLALTTLAGCSVYSVPGRPPAPVEEEPDYTVVTPPDAPAPGLPPTSAPVPEPNASHAYGSLLARADTATTRGDYEQALALLERAQRIDPGSGEIYLQLAQTYAAKGDASSSRATAERGLLYCRDTLECDRLRSLSR